MICPGAWSECRQMEHPYFSCRFTNRFWQCLWKMTVNWVDDDNTRDLFMVAYVVVILKRRVVQVRYFWTIPIKGRFFAERLWYLRIASVMILCLILSSAHHTHCFWNWSDLPIWMKTETIIYWKHVCILMLSLVKVPASLVRPLTWHEDYRAAAVTLVRLK